MFLQEPDRSPFDLRFSFFGIETRVHPWFWAISAVLGWSWASPAEPGGMKRLLIWITVLFLSVFIHEMGHVLTGITFGSRGHIVLYGFGGLAVGSSNLSNRWQRIAVYLAGPFTQLILWAIVVLSLYARYAAIHVTLHMLVFAPGVVYVLPMPEWLQESLLDILVVNLYWALLNLVPIWPLDGGRVSRDLFDWLAPRKGVRYSLILSLATAALIAVNSVAAQNGHPLIKYLPTGGMMLALFFAMFAIDNFQELQRTPAAPTYQEPRAPWERDPDYWKR